MKEHIDKNNSLVYTNVEILQRAVIEMLRLDVNSGTTANKVQAVAANKEKKLKAETKDAEEDAEEDREGDKKEEEEEDKEGSVTKTTEEEETARTFYTHFDGILYECSWYEMKHEIIVVNGVKEKINNKNEKKKKKAKKKGKDKTSK